MNEKFFLKLLELSAAHAKRSQAIFERLNLSNAQPKVLYILRKTDGYTQKNTHIKFILRQKGKKLLKKFIPNLKSLKRYALMVFRRRKKFMYLIFLTK